MTVTKLEGVNKRWDEVVAWENLGDVVAGLVVLSCEGECETDEEAGQPNDEWN